MSLLELMACADTRRRAIEIAIVAHILIAPERGDGVRLRLSRAAHTLLRVIDDDITLARASLTSAAAPWIDIEPSPCCDHALALAADVESTTIGDLLSAGSFDTLVALLASEGNGRSAMGAAA